MPWKESVVVDQRLQFLSAYQRDEATVTDLCYEFGVSRPTAYKWINRYKEAGPEGLLDVSRRPHGCAHATPEAVENEILALRKRYPSWGARKLKGKLERVSPNVSWPAASTIGHILNRAGLANPKRKKRRVTPCTEPFAEVTAPNQLWCMDFKGLFRLGNGSRCDPLTITDAYSRYLIRCQVVTRMDLAQVSAICDAAMREFGVPERIRTDNGAPFAGQGILGLSKLSLKWVRLGIIHERIRPGRPQQNGRHERMHRTLKEETTRPPANSLPAQQRKFDHFRLEFNDERPHEALKNETPGSIYLPSARIFPKALPEYTYPLGFLRRKVNNSGDMSWKHKRVFVSEVFRGEEVGLEHMGEGIYRVFYCHIEVGEFDSSDLRFRPRPKMI